MFNLFSPFSKLDSMGYAGALNLLNGSKPLIHHVDTKDDVSVDVILSGSGDEGTIVSIMVCDGDAPNEYILSLPGFNRTHQVVALSIVNDFKDYEDTKEAISGIVSDYGMTPIFIEED